MAAARPTGQAARADTPEYSTHVVCWSEAKARGGHRNRKNRKELASKDGMHLVRTVRWKKPELVGAPAEFEPQPSSRGGKGDMEPAP